MFSTLPALDNELVETVSGLRSRLTSAFVVIEFKPPSVVILSTLAVLADKVVLTISWLGPVLSPTLIVAEFDPISVVKVEILVEGISSSSTLKVLHSNVPGVIKEQISIDLHLFVTIVWILPLILYKIVIIWELLLMTFKKLKFFDRVWSISRNFKVVKCCNSVKSLSIKQFFLS